MSRYWPAIILVLTVVCTHAAEIDAPKKHAAAARLEGSLTLDGKLDEPAWQKAPDHTGFENPLGQANRAPIPDEMQTHFRVLYDDAHLYFGILCNEPKMDELTLEAARHQHDAAMWSDDDVEIFLEPVGDRIEYYQFAVNAEGTQADLYMIERGNTAKANWSSDWQAEVFHGPDYWSLEVAIPFAAFHMRPSTRWSDTWGFSISRTRTPDPRFYSQYSPARGYHDVVNYGTLGPIKVDPARYTISAGDPSFRLEAAEGGYRVFASVMLQNRGDAAFTGTLGMAMKADGSSPVQALVELAPQSSVRIDLPPATVAKTGRHAAIIKLDSAANYPVLISRCDEWLDYVPVSIHVTAPAYRNCVYATQRIETISGLVALGLPEEQVKGMTVRVSLSSPLCPPRSAEVAVEGTQVAFELPATDLAVGDSVLRAELLRPADGGKLEPVEEEEVPFHVLPPAPAVEVRVDDQGNLLINGSPIFIRGWYGSMAYCVSTASFPQAQLPHSTNFMMGSTEFEQTDLGLYTLNGITRFIDETKAKLDAPIDAELRAKLREAIARTWHSRNVIGYYISDEPECRGLSPRFLKSLYEFMAQEDPYRFCMIVSRSPATYIGACDVMCPHPYLTPQQYEDGRREFGNDLRHIHNVISEAADANDGSKAIWSMPQTFTYGGLHGVHPSFSESRWFTFTSLANGAQGIVPFIFSGFWGHYENRVAMNAVFEELTLLAPAWTARDTVTEALSDNAGVDVTARYYRPEGAVRGHTFIVAANQSYEPATAMITVPLLAQNSNSRLLVVRENRVVPVVDGAFTDTFAGLGVHVYTTHEVLPHLQTLEELEREIATALAQPGEAGNLLATGTVRWSIGEPGRTFQSDFDIADGRTDGAAWMPVYEDRTQCPIIFEKPVTFRRVVVDSPTIKSAELDVWADGDWKALHRWEEQYLHRFEYQGEPVTTDRIRIRPISFRDGYGSWVYPEITELGVYE